MQVQSCRDFEYREIRIFISSTFIDMQKERDELVKFVFPRLRKVCEQRGVTWNSVDLRWGIPAEEVTKGRVLSTCLEEIHRCRPYFIGILGERYGWIPDKIDPSLIESEPWLAEEDMRSITELEILHGVLNNPQMADHAFFYFRDPGYIASLPSEQQREYREEHGSNSHQKLTALKERIRSAGFPIKENYTDPRAFGRCVEKDLTRVINQLFPEGTKPGPLERERLQHEAFASSRVRVYIPDQAYYNRLESHICQDEPPLVITGESGSGKSALLANWALGYRQRHPDDYLLFYFIGSTAESVNWESMLRYLMAQLQVTFGIQGEIPDEMIQLRQEFINWLSMGAVQTRIILVIDGLNQLEDRGGALDLVWLPGQVPPNVRIILSTLPGRPLEVIQERSWPTLKVSPLDPADRQQLTIAYLSQYRKKLTAVHMQQIITAPQTANPLFLRTLLEELRTIGKHELLGEQIAHYLEAETIQSLFERILARYETDYNRDRPNLVQDSLSLIWAARRGLTESELLDLLGSHGNPLPSAYWSPLYLASEASLILRSGKINFFHSYFREAVEKRYLHTHADQQKAHQRLSEYFNSRELNPRTIDELPWQLMQAQSWESLYQHLVDVPFLEAVWEADVADVKTYWAHIERYSQFRLKGAYPGLIDYPEEHEGALYTVSRLFFEMGYPHEALTLLEVFIQLAMEMNDPNYFADGLQLKASILREQGKLDEAMELLRVQEQVHRDFDDQVGLSGVFNNQALILQIQGDLQGALRLFIEQEHLSQKYGVRRRLAESLHNQGAIHFTMGNVEEASKLFTQAEQIIREFGDRIRLVDLLGNRAAILFMQGDLLTALELNQEVENLDRMLGNKAHLAATIGNQALIHRHMGDLDRAMQLHKEEERLVRDLGDTESLSISLSNQALIHKSQGNLSQALEQFSEAETLARKVGAMRVLQACLGNQSSILHQQGELNQALSLRKEEVKICRQAGYRRDLAQALFTQSELLFDLKQYDESVESATEAYELAKELGMHEIRQELEQRWFPP